ncbi:MAG: hypothetical protein J7K37_04485 [Candidatus Omnitrophica bacterium]|nr:hypothetical protein [Candidatus Omnitrophota bacterium]
MKFEEGIDIICDFFLDGAKILFASLVVGAFIPSATGKIPWLTFSIGIAITVSFLIIAIKLSKKDKE